MDNLTVQATSTEDVRLVRPKFYFPDMRRREGERPPKRAEIRICINGAEVGRTYLEEGQTLLVDGPYGDNLLLRAGERLEIVSSEPGVRVEV